jgi:aldehyde:ferredoxin oxidoreductase
MGFGTREHDRGPYRAMGPVTAEEYESRAERYDTRPKDNDGVPTLETLQRLGIDFPWVVEVVRPHLGS